MAWYYNLIIIERKIIQHLISIFKMGHSYDKRQQGSTAHAPRKDLPRDNEK